MTDYIQAILTVLSLINPVICTVIFLKSQSQLPKSHQIKAAAQAMSSVFIILALSAVLGTQILTMFGISLSAFSVAGGLVLGWMGFSMLSKKPSKPDFQDDDAEPSGASLIPLILFAASPGTITGVITLSVVHTALGIPLTALVAVTVACAVTLLFLAFSIQMGTASQKGNSLWRDTMSRFMGLIVLAMGIQFALSGLKSFFN
jgi:multiple antibiotic resistance protein